MLAILNGKKADSTNAAIVSNILLSSARIWTFGRHYINISIERLRNHYNTMLIFGHKISFNVHRGTYLSMNSTAYLRQQDRDHSEVAQITTPEGHSY